MLTKTFEGQVKNGQLRYVTSLDDFEGQQVSVTVRAPAERSAAPATGSQDAAPPEDMDVEQDVYVPMPLPSEVLKDVQLIEGGPLQPCIILPEELPDAD